MYPCRREPIYEVRYSGGLLDDFMIASTGEAVSKRPRFETGESMMTYCVKSVGYGGGFRGGFETGSLRGFIK